MGTSKGYIAPSTPYWSRAKRSVTSYLGNPSDNKRNSAASGYAKAMGSAGFSNNRAVHAFSGIASFAAFSGANGYQAALREIEYGRTSLRVTIASSEPRPDPLQRS